LFAAAVQADAADERGRKRKKKRRRRRSRSSSSRSSEDEEASGPHFRGAPARSDAHPIAAIALRQPGHLYEVGLDEIRKFLGVRDPAGADTASSVRQYLNTIYFAAHPVEKVGLRNARELQTLALALDEIGNGRLPQAADVLMQRFKAVEVACSEGSWSLAQRLELLPPHAVGLASVNEQRLAAKAELLSLKLSDAKRKSKESRKDGK
jgi:hypothetical protein